MEALNGEGKMRAFAIQRKTSCLQQFSKREREAHPKGEKRGSGTRPLARNFLAAQKHAIQQKDCSQKDERQQHHLLFGLFQEGKGKRQRAAVLFSKKGGGKASFRRRKCKTVRQRK